MIFLEGKCFIPMVYSQGRAAGSQECSIDGTLCFLPAAPTHHHMETEPARGLLNLPDFTTGTI